jgi:hypothetical protein
MCYHDCTLELKVGIHRKTVELWMKSEVQLIAVHQY